VIETLEGYSSNLALPISMMVMSTQYSPQIGRADLQGGITAFISHIKQLPGVSDFEVVQETTNISGKDGFEQSGSFNSNGKLRKFISVGLGEGLLLWQVMVVYNGDNEEMEDLAEDVIDSIEILYNTGV
jgi:hypothetical protein